MTIYITELLTGLLVIAGLFIWGGEGSVADWQIQSSFLPELRWLLALSR